MESRFDVAAALTEAARTINSCRDLDSTLTTIVETAARSLPGIDHVGISIAHRDGKIETRAATDELVFRLDQIQYDLGEGPCLHAIRSGPVVKIEHAEREQRWPHFISAALDEGLRAQMGLRLYTDEETLGGLNLYSVSSSTIEPEVEHMAELFAAHAAIALGRSRREEQLNTALETRRTIGQALGIVMERFGIDEDRAFAFLIRTSTHSNTKLKEIAEGIVADRNARSRPIAGST